MSNILNQIYTVYAWGICSIAFSFHMIVVLIFGRFFKDQIGFSIKCTRPILRVAFWLTGVRLAVQDSHYIPIDQSFIVVANHQSHVDIPCFLLAITQNFSFVAKKELLSVPIVGWDIRSQGHIAIDRNNPRQARRILQTLVTKIKSNALNLVIFAEGTRSASGELGEFKMGAFDLSARSGAVIIPAAITGSINVLKKNSRIVRPGKITIQFCPPIEPPKSTDFEDMEETRSQVVAAISKSIAASTGV